MKYEFLKFNTCSWERIRNTFFPHKININWFFFLREDRPMKNLIRENCWGKLTERRKTPRKEVDSQVTFRNGALDRNDLTNIYEWLWITRIANRNARHAHSSVHISFSYDVSRRHRLVIIRLILLYSRDSNHSCQKSRLSERAAFFGTTFNERRKKDHMTKQ